MGFKNGAYAKCWSFEQSSPKVTKVRLSISRKTDSGYEPDFSGFVSFIGRANEKVKGLPEGARIRLDECDVSTKYDRANKKEYINYKVFDFTLPDGGNSGGQKSSPAASKPVKKAAFDDEPEYDEDSDEDLPY